MSNAYPSVTIYKQDKNDSVIDYFLLYFSIDDPLQPPT